MELRRAWIFGCGYLGHVVLSRWLAAGVEVTVSTRSPEKAAAFRNLGAKAVVSGHEEPSLATPPDVVLWSVGFERRNPPTNTRQEAWLEGVERLGRRLGELPTLPRFVYVSTTGVYGDAAGTTVDESTPPAPESEGGRVALATEEAARQLGAASVAVRLAGLVGPGRLLRPIEEIRRGLVVRAAPEAWLNLVHVDDAATLVDAVARVDVPPAIVNGAMRDTPTRRAYYEGLALRLGAPAPRFAPEGENGTGRRVQSSVRASLTPFRHETIASALDAIVDAAGIEPPLRGNASDNQNSPRQ